MSSVRISKLGDYYSTNPVLYSPYLTLYDLVETNSYKVLRYLHVVENTPYMQMVQPGYDKLAKFRFLINHLLETTLCKFQKPNLVLDKVLIVVQRRFLSKVCMISKPARFGFMVDCVYDSTNCIICNFAVHTGQEDNSMVDLVMRVMHKFAVAWDCIFFASFL